MPFLKGDILLPINKVKRKNWLRGLRHPAVVWNNEYDGDSDFLGIMLTHASPNEKFQNIPMANNHFEKGHKIGFDDTHFVNQIFVKFQGWGPFIQVGKLTNEGVIYIESKINPDSWPI